MKWLDRIASKFGYAKRDNAPKIHKRGYSGAEISRLFQDWAAPSTDANAEAKPSVRRLRNRSRDLERNDDYTRRYFQLLENNVLGANGIGLQMKVRKGNREPDKAANDAIEAAWAKWGKKRNCCVNRGHTWRGACRLILRAAKRDGGLFIRKVKGFDNEFRYALQLLEIDHLDLDFNASLASGNVIEGGIEINAWGEPVAYHIFRKHPGSQQIQRQSARRERVPAEDMLHVFLPDRISQLIGAPATSSTITRIKMLHGYQEAELVAARVAACKGHAITQATPDGYSGETDDQNRIVESVEPGQTLLLNPGEQIQDINPQHPVQAFPDFIKSNLRGIAGGFGVSYNSLANDLEGVNFSSIRAGLLEEREEWKAVQQWFCEDVCEPIFEDWLAWSLGFGFIKSGGGTLGLANFDYYNQPEWKSRRWPWVDPEKDVEANRKAIALRLKSRRGIIADEGEDIDEVDADFEADPITSDLNHAVAYVPEAAKVKSAQGAADATPAAVPVTQGPNGRIIFED